MRLVKQASYLMALLVALESGAAFAQGTDCLGGGYAAVTSASTTLANSTACYPVGGPYTNQEYFLGSALWDYKKGSGDPIDPSSNIGTVGFGGASVTYSYAGGPTLTYTVYGPNGSGNYIFCNGASGMLIQVVSGQSGCG
jgi:hypothetical protein